MLCTVCDPADIARQLAAAAIAASSSPADMTHDLFSAFVMSRTASGNDDMAEQEQQLSDDSALNGGGMPLSVAAGADDDADSFGQIFLVDEP